MSLAQRDSKKLRNASAKQFAIDAFCRTIDPNYKTPQQESKPIWSPLPGKPQEAAYHTKADILGYGGAAGGGKSDLLLGLACTAHRDTVIFRRQNTQNQGFIKRSLEVMAEHGKFNASKGIWSGLPGNRQIELAGVKDQASVFAWRGRPHDFIGIDEADAFTEFQFRFLTGWNRTTIVGQRCRVVLTFNPPATAEGRWLLDYFAPWLKKDHPNPAVPGELRWYAVIDGVDVERPDGKPFVHTTRDGRHETIQPKSRTFIPASVTDNPYLMATGYVATLQNLPEPLRSQLLYGDFSAGLEDDEWQVIPTAWVELAQKRWTENPPEGAQLSVISADPARGGQDKTSLASIYGGVYAARLKKYAGKDTPDGPSVANRVHQIHDGKCEVVVDVIGIGSSVYDFLKEPLGDLVIPFDGSSAVDLKDKTGKYHLRNARTASYWKFREILDPHHGENIALPPDAELLADLCAPRYKIAGGVITVEKKEDIKKRLGRSPDCGDAVVMGFAKDWIRKRLPTGWFKVMSSQRSFKSGYNIIVCEPHDLPNIRLDVRNTQRLHIEIEDILNGEVRAAARNVEGIDTLTLKASVLDPLRLPTLDDAKFLMQREEAKKTWSFLLKKRFEPITTVVLIESGGYNRAISLAYALCDAMVLPRSKTIWHYGHDDPIPDKANAPLARVYDTIRNSRGLVIG